MTKRRRRFKRIGHPQAARTWPPIEGAARRQAIRELQEIVRLEGKPSLDAIRHRFIVSQETAEALLNEATKQNAALCGATPGGI